MSSGSIVKTIIRISLKSREDAELLKALDELKRKGRLGTYSTMAIRNFYHSEIGQAAFSILLGDLPQGDGAIPSGCESRVSADGKQAEQNISKLDEIFKS